MRVVFMGTPAFAVPSLRALVEHAAPGVLCDDGLELVGVFTRVDKPVGRRRQAVDTPIKAFALAQGLPVYQPGPLRRPEALEQVRTLAPDLILVAAFGQILPPAILALPSRGCLNVHASMLPRWRGASPIAAAILAGDEITGVTLMLMAEGLDTGPMLARRATPIGAEETTGQLTERLAQLGADLLVETLPGWLAGAVTPEAQDDAQATMTTLLRKEDGRLDWTRPATELARQTRACTPWPGAWTTWNGQVVKIARARALADAMDGAPGQCSVLRGAQRLATLACACGQGALALEVIQLPGKRAMPSEDALRGYPALATAQFSDPPDASSQV